MKRKDPSVAADLIAFQLYSLRAFGGLADQLALLSRIGYRQVETTKRNYDDPSATRRLLEQNGMQAPSGHFTLDQLRNHIEWVITVARVIGLRHIVFPGPFDGEANFDSADWRAAGRLLGEIGGQLEKQGFSLAFHNHDGEFRLMPDGRPALDHLFDGAEALPLFWQADIGWLARAGADPGFIVAQMAQRLTSCHVKDLAFDNLSSEGGWTTIGQGRLDWKQLWPACRAAGAGLMIVEHDEPLRPEVFARDTFDFLNAASFGVAL